MNCSAAEWDEFLLRHPGAHILQSSAWGELKSQFGWSAERIRASDCGAQVLFRRLPLGLTVGYIPKGPVGAGWSLLWPELERLCRQHRAIFLKVEPDAWEPRLPERDGALAGLTPSAPIQPRRTLLVDLQGTEDNWLERMKQKTRYNVRLAERKGVTVRLSTREQAEIDLQTFQRLMETTGQRDQFGVHAAGYYRRAFDLFSAGGRCALLIAESGGQSLAGLMAFVYGTRAWYFYGASADEARNLMPTYLLQWEAMRWAFRCGCHEYDLWGVPDVDEDELEKDFTERSDGLWGVYRFKRGFGGRLVRSVGAWDKVYDPVLYRLYRMYVARRGGEAAG